MVSIKLIIVIQWVIFITAHGNPEGFILIWECVDANCQNCRLQGNTKYRVEFDTCENNEKVRCLGGRYVFIGDYSDKHCTGTPLRKIISQKCYPVRFGHDPEWPFTKYNCELNEFVPDLRLLPTEEKNENEFVYLILFMIPFTVGIIVGYLLYKRERKKSVEKVSRLLDKSNAFIN